MGREQLRNWWSLGAKTGIALVVGWLLYLVWQSPPPRRDDWSTYGAFALAVAAIVVGWLARAWQKGKTGRIAGSESLDDVADHLAAVVQAQWKKEAEERGLTGADPIRVTWGRPSMAMAGPAAAAVGSRRFGPLPGLTAAGEAELASGQAADLYALYGGLRSGRLIIAGPPGSGKSGAAVLLVLAALRHREQIPAQDQPLVPVPVLVTCQDWNPDRQPVADWLARKLQDTYPLLAARARAGTAAALLAAGRIAVILDGLDEIGSDLRPVALQALSQQATFRLVLLSRTSEMAAAASSQGVLHGAAAVELNPVGPAEAASYLERVQLDPPPAGWHELIRRLRADPGSPLSLTLDNPLALTLVRDTYQTENSVRELLEFCGPLDGMPADWAVEAIIGHLLDRFLAAVYTRRPGQPPLPYDLATAQRTLARIAARMNQDGTRNLNWWQIPAWAPRKPRVIASAIAGALTGGLLDGFRYGLSRYAFAGMLGGALIGGFFVSGLAGEGLRRLLAKLPVIGWDESRVPGNGQLTNALNWPNLVGVLGWGLAAGFVAGPATGFVVGLWAVAGSMFLDSFRADADSNSTLSPATSWHRNRRYGLAIGFVTGIPFGLAAGLTIGYLAWHAGFMVGHIGFMAGFMAGLGIGFIFGLMLGPLGTESYSLTLASVQLAIGWRTPMRLMRFLNDAHSRNVLRAVGPSYQFRHARLQDQIDAATTTTAVTPTQ
jgi:hypothetical protein